MTDEIPFPTEIRACWKEALDALDLDPSEKCTALAIVAYSQPPMYVEAFDAASALYAADHGIMVSATSLDAIRKSADISSARPERPGRNYPVYFALTRSDKLGNPQCHASQFARHFLSNI